MNRNGCSHECHEAEKMSRSCNVRTLENLHSLFARDAETLLRYRCFAVMSRSEGADAVAELFDRLAEGQLLLAEGHLDVLRNVGDPLSGLPLRQTREILQAAVAAEKYDVGDLLPAMASVADAEGFASVASWVRSVGLVKGDNVARLETLLTQASSTMAEE